MSSNVAVSKIPLSRGWRRRVRSAVIHTIALAHTSLTHARSVAANSINARIRLKEEIDRLRNEISLLGEESRIKDARMEQIPAQRRPHYAPIERLAILELRAARGWSLTQTAEHFLVTPLTIASWTKRLDEDGADALVQVPEPVNRFPDFVGYLVRRLKVLCPMMGKARIANVLCRAGLHLGSTTVRRMLRETEKPKPPSSVRSRKGRVVTARRPNNVWFCDLTTVPTSLGFWVPWPPLALPPIWPFCWWIAVIVDHFSRRVMGVTVFTKEPTSKAIRNFIDRAISAAGEAPNHLISDRGTQFTDNGFPRWCRRRRIQHRFGAVGKYGSVAVIERLMRTLKAECTRQLVFVPFRRASFVRELTLWSSWHNAERPHETLGARTPDEIYFHRRPACGSPRFEPRTRWPRGAPCAGPHALIRGRPGVRVDLDVRYTSDRKHLPVVAIRKAA
jgi:putative transposase